MDMQTFFSEITALCRNEQFLHSVMEKYHYDPEEYIRNYDEFVEIVNTKEK